MFILNWFFFVQNTTHDVVYVWKGHFFCLLGLCIGVLLTSTKKLRLPNKTTKEEIKKILGLCIKKPGLEDVFIEII